jgi:short-subunit dehydrogenase
MWELTRDDWAWAVEVNLWGVIHGIRAFVPHLVEQGSGHVLNTASMGGISALPGNAPYMATKHALVAITEGLRLELTMAGATGVGASVLCPGLTITNIGNAARNRPNSLADTAESKGFRSAPAAIVTNPMTAEAVAEAALEGIERDRLLVMPSPGGPEAVRRRAEGMLAVS